MISATWSSGILTAEAKANLLCNSSDIARWEHSFLPALGSGNIWENMTFDGVEMESDRGNLIIEAGEWRVVQYNGDWSASNKVSFYVDGNFMYDFTDPNLAQEYLFSVPYGETKTVRAVQTQGRFATHIQVIQMQGYNTPGDNPEVSMMGDQLTVTLGRNNSPRKGVLTATPKVFSAAGAELASGNSVSMIISVGSGGGGC